MNITLELRDAILRFWGDKEKVGLVVIQELLSKRGSGDNEASLMDVLQIGIILGESNEPETVFKRLEKEI